MFNIITKFNLHHGNNKIKATFIMLFSFIFIFIFTFLLSLMSIEAYSLEKIKPQQSIVNLINKMFMAFMMQDQNERIKALLPLLHKTLKTNDNKWLKNNILNFSYKKALLNYKFYKYPIEIAYVIKGKNLTVGYGENSDYGRIDKYFIKKKQNVPGTPALIGIFIPIINNKPIYHKAKIINFGSL